MVPSGLVPGTIHVHTGNHENHKRQKGCALELFRHPTDPPVLKILRRVNFGTGSKFGTDAAKRYGEGSEMLGFLGRRGRKNGTDNEKLRPKILRIQAPYYF